jgi:uncharacterized protein YueI
MKTFMYIALLVATSVLAIVGFARSIDAALEIDDLKSGSSYVNREMNFLQAVTNEALVSCEITLDKFGKIAKENGYAFRMVNKEQIEIGTFIVTIHDSCISKMSSYLVDKNRERDIRFYFGTH